MIRINLLPVRAAQKKEKMMAHVVILVSSLVLTLLICAAAYYLLSSQVAELKAQIQTKEAEKIELKKVSDDVDGITARKKTLQDKLDVLAELKENRTGPVRLLDELSIAIPEKVWITSFKESGGSIAISGTGMNEETVADFLQRLEESPYYEGIELQIIQKKTESGQEVQTFKIVCSAETANKE
ncbi:MAG: hypothetical protein C0615_08455 [Desulfuromonas sp.]|nr:MAG: hypothetical protein C0615_08455 [Desulfuromonas sp.]